MAAILRDLRTPKHAQGIGSLDARIDLAHKEAADENAEEDGPEC